MDAFKYEMATRVAPASTALPQSLTEAQLDNLQWALDFMKKYEKRKK